MAPRLNIRTLKSLSWLSVVGALAWAGFTFWDIYDGKQNEGRYEPRPVSDIGAILARDTDEARQLRDTRATYPANRQRMLWEARVDGSVKPKPKDPSEQTVQPEVDPEPQVPALDTVLEVSLVVWSDDPPARFVGVKYAEDAAEPTRNTKQRRLHLTQGEPLRSPFDEAPYHGKVLTIGKQQVTFAWGGDEVTLTPKLGRDGSGVTAEEFRVEPRGDPLAQLDGVPEKTVRLDDGSYVIGTQDIEVFRSQGSQIVESLGVRTITPKDGGPSSIELMDVPADSILKTYGFSSGDRIISVNGIPMSSKSQAWNWYEQNPDLPTYEVKYESKGAQKTTTIHNPDAG